MRTYDIRVLYLGLLGASLFLGLFGLNRLRLSPVTSDSSCVIVTSGDNSWVSVGGVVRVLPSVKRSFGPNFHKNVAMTDFRPNARDQSDSCRCAGSLEVVDFLLQKIGNLEDAVFYPSDGTLLGFTRGGDIIDGDDD
jgi:hypothetical protein